MKKYKFIVVLAILFAITMVSFAQLTETSGNECDEGGLLDGRCNTTDVDLDGDVEQDDIDWMWTCGYYLSQVDDAITMTNDEIPLDGCRIPEREIRRPEKGSPYVPREKSCIIPDFPSLTPGLQSIDPCAG